MVSPLVGTRNLNHMLGIYANDQWTRGRLTLNLGLRFDYKNSSVPAVTQPAGRFLPERTYAAVEDVPNWKDLGPRLGGGLRPVWRRPDGAEVRVEPVCRRRQLHRRGQFPESSDRGVEQRQPGVERPQREFHPRV